MCLERNDLCSRRNLRNSFLEKLYPGKTGLLSLFSRVACLHLVDGRLLKCLNLNQSKKSVNQGAISGDILGYFKAILH